MERHGAEVDLSPEAVREAAARLPALRAHPLSRLAGGPFRIDRELHFPAADLPPEAHGRVFDAVRRVVKRPSRVEELLGAVEWSPRTGEGGSLSTPSLELSRVEDGVRLHVTQRRGTEAGILLSCLPLYGGLAAAMVAGAAGAAAPVVGAAAAAGAALSLAGTAAVLRRSARQHRRRLGRLLEEVNRAVTGNARDG